MKPGLKNNRRNRMPVVIVEMWEGRSEKQKKQLVRDLTDAFVKIGTPESAVQVILKESPKSCWAQSGKLCSDFEAPQGA
jgi:4-oxalocrotonate tautomerase